MYMYMYMYLSHPLTHSPTDSITHSLNHPLTQSLTHSLTQSPTHSLTQPLTHPLTQSPTHPLTYRAMHVRPGSLKHSSVRPLSDFIFQLDVLPGNQTGRLRGGVQWSVMCLRLICSPSSFKLLAFPYKCSLGRTGGGRGGGREEGGE